MSNPLQALRDAMQTHGVDAVLIPSSDFHGSEYTGAHFACRTYISGFTGSAGTLLVFADWAGLWTDGRYFLQAERELCGSGIHLMREGLPETPNWATVLSKRLKSSQCLAFDGRCISAKTGTLLRKNLSVLSLTFQTELDLPGSVWNDRPSLSAQPVWLLDSSYAGESRSKKLARSREALCKLCGDTLLLTALEEICWLLNLRGGDIDCTPVALSYLALSQSEAILFINPAQVAPEIAAQLGADGVSLRDYEDFYSYAAAIPMEQTVLLDGRRANLRLRDSLPTDVRVLDRPSPIEAFKAVKNAVEIENMRLAHLKDGIALTHFLYWLKQNIGTQPITEQSAAAKLESFRQEQPHYLGSSFSPIVGYGAHAAIVHYCATAETNAPLLAEGLVLVDTGGHYLEGTTDCTRTIALGPLTDGQRQHYTAVLRGHLQLSNAQFLYGCTGANLDYLARAPLWSMQLDYRHGTGHGVGYLLGVHEGPNQIRWRATQGAAVFEPGMITSDEPGMYLDGAYGIRLENLLLCVPHGESDYGRFLGFEPLTLAPFDPEALELSQMHTEELAFLNRYHQQVFDAISPYLSVQEADWLLQVTRPL